MENNIPDLLPVVIVVGSIFVIILCFAIVSWLRN